MIFINEPHLPVTEVAATAGFQDSPCIAFMESEGILPGSLSWNMINYPQRVLMPEGSLKEAQLKNIFPAPCQHILKEVLVSVGGDVRKKRKYLSVHWDWFHFLQMV